MAPVFSGIRLSRVLTAGAVAFSTSMALVILVIFVYAFMLGFRVRGQPNQADIQRFAVAVAPWLGNILASILSACAGAWVAIRVPERQALHGVLVGVVVAMGFLAIEFSQGMGLVDVAKVMPLVGAAWLGSVVAARLHT